MALTEENSTRPTSSRTLVQSVLLTFCSYLAFAGFSLLSGILTARLLGPTGKGQLATISTLAILAGYLVSMGFDQAVIRVVANGRAKWQEAVATVLVLYGLVCLIVLPAAALLLTRYHARLFPDIPLSILYVALAIIPLRMVIVSLNGALAGHHRLPESIMLQSLQLVAGTLGMAILIWFWRFGVLGGIIAQTAGIAIGVVVALYLLRGMPAGRWQFQRHLLPEIYRFGRGCYAATIAQSLNWRLDTFLVFALVGARSVGLYTVAVGLAEFPLYLPSSISVVLMPRVTGDAEGTEERTARLSRSTFFILLLAYGLLLLLGYPMIRCFYSSVFLPSYPAMVLLLPGLLAMGQSRILSADIIGRGCPRYPAMASWLSLTTMVALDLLLIPHWGIQGAALACTTSYLAANLVVVLSFRHLTGIRLRELYCIHPQEVRELLEKIPRLITARLHRSPDEVIEDPVSNI